MRVRSLGWTSVTVLIACHFEFAVGRGNSGKEDDPEQEMEENYFPEPRQPVPYNSTYVQKAPGATRKRPYTYKKGYYTSFYQQYLPHARTLSIANNSRHFTPDTLVCVNSEADDTGASLGAFTCPLPFEPSSFTACCGEQYAEFCCLPKEFITKLSVGRTVGIVAFFLGIICAGLIGVCMRLYGKGCMSQHRTKLQEDL